MSMMQAWFGTASTKPNVPGIFGWAGTYNNYGMFAFGTPTNPTSATLSIPLDTWTQVSVGSSHSAAIKKDGTLWVWGTSTSGQLGLGNRTTYSSPKQVGSLTSWSFVCCAPGPAYSPSTNQKKGATFAIKTDGTLWCWGLNNYGQLGLGNTTSYSSPKQIGSSTNWTLISAYGTSAAGLQAGGLIYTWGRNNYGQLGTGDTTNRSTPTAITVGLGGVYGVSCAGYHTIANRGVGILYSWGKNTNGQLGLGNITNYSVPTKISSSPAVYNWRRDFGSIASTDIKGTGGSSASTRTNGTLWVWGQTFFGSLGTGNSGRASYSTPQQIGVLTNWKGITINSYASQALKTTNGTMWGTGFTASNGLAPYGSRSVFTQQTVNTNWKQAAMAQGGAQGGMAIAGT